MTRSGSDDRPNAAGHRNPAGGEAEVEVLEAGSGQGGDQVSRAQGGVPEAAGDELPVVARLVVEIRSDGRRTIARGAMEDVATGRGAAVEARGDSPFKLALSLARAMLSVPALGRTATRALLRRPSPRRRRGDG